MSFCHPPALQRGSALILTMLMVSLISILLLGFVASMQMEIFSARSHLSSTRADFIAQAAMDTALARMRQTCGTNRFWISLPGRAIVSATGVFQPADTMVELSSGPASAADGSDQAVNLNVRSFTDSSRYLLSSGGEIMKVKWIYLHQDGTVDTASPPAYNPANPVVGRYAFWIDDENAKINVNTAWTRDPAINPAAPAHPSAINLNAVSPLNSSDVNAIQGSRSISHYYNSLNEIGAVAANAVYAVRTNGFVMTHFNHSPDLNMFGEPRIMLTTRKSRATAYWPGNTNFLNILKDPDNGDPGKIGDLDTPKTLAVINRIYAYLTRKDWPVLPGKSLAEKFSPADESRALQLALNIVDYVRSAESTTTIVEPLRAGWKLPGPMIKLTDAGGNDTLGNARGLRITEMGLLIFPQSTISSNTISAVFRVELYLPRDFGIASLDLTKIYLNTIANGNFTQSSVTKQLTSTVVDGGDTTIRAGEYRVVTQTHSLALSSAVRPSKVQLRCSLSYNNNASTPRYELAPSLAPGPDYIVDLSSGTNSSAITSLAVDDPCVNKHKSDWSQGPNTFGAVGAIHGPLSSGPQQDLDENGNLVRNSVRFPAPNSVVNSVGEIGFVHTGIECVLGAGTPWRTIRLQPRQSGSADLPDWLLLDLFSAPPPALASADKPYIFPSTGNIGGLVNLNAQIAPFTNSIGRPLLQRTIPLTAWFLNATNNGTPLNLTQARTLASNVINMTLAEGSRTTGVSYGTGAGTNIFYSRGQIVEIRGIADMGEASEDFVRTIVDLAAVRGNVFSIYSVGQAIKQSGSGITVLGEKRKWIMVERILSGTTIRFDPVFSQNLTH